MYVTTNALFHLVEKYISQPVLSYFYSRKGVESELLRLVYLVSVLLLKYSMWILLPPLNKTHGFCDDIRTVADAFD